MVVYREISPDELGEKLFAGFERRQVVGDCLRWRDGQWKIVYAPFVDQWSKEDYRFLVDCLRNTIRQEGVVYGAFEEGILKGFASVEGKQIGSKGQYRDLTSLHVSEEMRGKGIGKTLLSMAASRAKKMGAAKLYISAHSALETQRFYESQGCVDAVEIMKEHAKREPYDRQMELNLEGYGAYNQTKRQG